MTQSYWFLKRLAYLLPWLTSSRPLLLVAKSAIEAMLEEKNQTERHFERFALGVNGGKL